MQINKYKEFFYPIGLAVSLITLSLIGILISELILSNSSQSIPIFKVSSYSRNIFLVILVTSLIVFGIRAIRFYNKTFKAFLTVVMGLIFASFFAYVEYKENLILKSEKKALSIDIRKVEDRLDQHLFRHNTLRDRMVCSKEFAAAVYNEMGKKIEYLVAEDKYIIFEPSKQAEKHYREKKLHIEMIDKINIYFPIYTWITIVLGSFLLGMVTPIKKK